VINNPKYYIMALQLSGKTALVTGGGSGICLEFTKKLLASGCNVLVADLALRPEAEEVIKKGAKNAKAVFVKTDVTSWAELQNAFDSAIKSFGHLDIVVPGAGVFEPVCHCHKSHEWPKLTNIDSHFPIFGTSTQAWTQ
jgi:NAD(P)-dependent dehydrogenase (short-subunit alcohol dehydrogenase family)